MISSASPRSTFVLAVAVLAMGFAPASIAQPAIDFGTPVAASGPSELLTTGTFHSSITANPADVTVGGITFKSYTTSSISLTGASAIFYTPGTFSSGDAAYNTLINRGFYTGIEVSARMYFNNLTIGNVYRLQIWTPSWDGNAPTQILHEGTLVFGNTATAPTYAVGTFTASSATEHIDFAGTGGPIRGVIAAAAIYDVTAIPEPSTYAAMAGLGALGFAFWRRRARRKI